MLYAVATSLSKPESFVAVCVTDSLDLLFGGSDAPCAVGCLYSIGAINQENNAALTAAISELIADGPAASPVAGAAGSGRASALVAVVVAADATAELAAPSSAVSALASTGA